MPEMTEKPAKTSRFSYLAGSLSLIIPGLGQLYQRDWKRGIAVFFLVATSLATTLWYGKTGWYVLTFGLWIWNVWDAARLPKGAPVGLAALLWLFMAYGIGWQVTDINPWALFANPERARSIVAPMLQPDLVEPRTNKLTGRANFELPCSANPAPSEHTENGVRVWSEPPCGKVGDTITLSAEGLWPNKPVEFIWLTPINGVAQTWNLSADADGRLKYSFVIPLNAMAGAIDPNIPMGHKLTVSQTEKIGGYRLSVNGGFLVKGIYETLALALLATTLGAILALPFGFLGARNLMGGNPITMAIYFVVRTFLNIVRSIESLIMAIIFVVIVGLGPFPGMLAITVHTVAALGKLFSEVVEGIDAGPIEAIRATGANWLQVVRFGVIPQIVPLFTALTIYRWDINVRSSTIIGFVGGGGIGFLLYQWILIGDYRAVSSSFIAIAVVVVVLDFFSARLREGIK